ncbi:MAG: polysaccharide biosynthesis protein [Acidobacteriaceae bacterium]
MQTDFFDASHRASLACWAEMLGREAASTDPILIPGIAGRRVLVTGAGGFIGSEMVRVLAASGAKPIILLEIAKQALLTVSAEMTACGFGDRCIPILGSVGHRALLAALFDEYHPEVILHAAALKHVPLMEHNPFAAVATNGIATWRLAKIAAEHRVRQMILVSTDKAVAPHSIMGASKRIAELAALAHPEFATAVRLVNVIGSPGSVVPLFAEQTAADRPVTVTHRASSRFFITLHEVVELLAQALGASACGILVPNPGEPIRIQDLARRMIAASGRNVPVLFTEPRPGDKLRESLVSPSETCDGYATLGLRRVVGPSFANLETHIAALETAIATRNLPELLRLVQDLVPNYEPSALLRHATPEPASAR